MTDLGGGTTIPAASADPAFAQPLPVPPSGVDEGDLALPVTRAEFDARIQELVDDYASISATVKELDHSVPTTVDIAEVLSNVKSDYEANYDAVLSKIQLLKSDISTQISDLQAEISSGSGTGSSSSELQSLVSEKAISLSAEVDNVEHEMQIAIDRVNDAVELLQSSVVASSPTSENSLSLVKEDVDALASRSSELEAQSSLLEGLHHEVSDLQAVLLTTSSATTTSLDEFRSSIEGLQSEVSAAEERANQLEALETKVADLQTLLTSSAPTSSESLQLVNVALDELTSRLNTLVAGGSDAASTISAAQASLEQLQSRAAAVDIQTSENSATIAHLQTELGSLESRTSTLETEIPFVKTALSSVSDNLSENQAAVAQIQSWIDSHPLSADDWLAMKQRLLEVQENLEHTKQTVETVSSKVQEMQQTSDSLTAQSSDAATALTQLQDTVGSIGDALDQVKELVEIDIPGKHDAINASLGKIAVRIGDAETLIADLVFKSDALHQFQSDATNALAGLDSRLSEDEAQLQEKKTSLQSAIEAQKTELMSDITELGVKVDQNKSGIEALQDIAVEKADELAEIINQLRQGAEKDIETLDNKLEDLTSGITKTGAGLLSTVGKITEPSDYSIDVDVPHQEAPPTDALPEDMLPLLPFASEDLFFADISFDFFSGDFLVETDFDVFDM